MLYYENGATKPRCVIEAAHESQHQLSILSGTVGIQQLLWTTLGQNSQHRREPPSSQMLQRLSWMPQYRSRPGMPSAIFSSRRIFSWIDTFRKLAFVVISKFCKAENVVERSVSACEQVKHRNKANSMAADRANILYRRLTCFFRCSVQVFS